MLNFPDAPTNGQVFAGPAGSFTYDGTKWAPTLMSALYAPINSPTFTGDPKAPTPTPGDNDTSIATTAFVAAAIPAGMIPGGSNTQIQYNSSGTFAGSANLAWNNTTSVMTLTGQLAINTGNATSIVAAGGVTANNFVCAGTIANLAPASLGNVVLRPSGPASASGQVQITPTSVIMNSPVTLPADPTSALQAATKQYVDTANSAKVAKAGDTMTGSLSTVNLNTSGYVLSQGNVVSNAGYLQSITSGAQGMVQLGNTGGAYLQFDSAAFQLVGGPLVPQQGIKGKVDGSAAAAGIVGELLQGTASDVNIPNGVWTAFASLSLPAGDWDVWAWVYLSVTTQPTRYHCSLGPGIPAGITLIGASPSSYSLMAFMIGPIPAQISSPATYYLSFYNLDASFMSGTNNIIYARRRR